MRGKPSKMILSILVTMLIICSIGTTVSAAKRFSDVDASHPYYKGVMWATSEAKIANGYADRGVFGIDEPCTRGHAMMFLWKLAGKPTPNTSGRMPFKDVPSKHPYYKAILWGAQSGITKGYSDGTFGINKECTRGQIVAFIWRMAGKPNPVTKKSPFKDVNTKNTFYKAILWGSQKGITKGYTSGPNKGKFGVNDNCTRGQIMTFLYRAK